MPRDKSVSHEKIIVAAMDEFTEYGYEKASMRRIGQRCGLTAAALYRHFENKEALFESLVESASNDLKEWITSHIREEEERIRSQKKKLSFDEYIDSWKSLENEMLRTLIYPRIDEYSMLFNRNNGPRYEHFLKSFVAFNMQGMRTCIEWVKDSGYKIREVSDKELLIIVQSYSIALLEPVMSGMPLEDAETYYRTIDVFFRTGWKKLLGIE